MATGLANAQTPPSARVDATALIIPRVSIAASAGSDGKGNLDFGLVVLAKKPITETINPNTDAHAGLLTVGGAPLMALSISYTAPDLSDTSGHTIPWTLQVVGDTLSSNQGTAASATTGSHVTVSSTGNYYLWLGESVTVAAGTNDGDYKSIINLTASY